MVMLMIKQVYFLDFYNSLIEGDKENCTLIVSQLYKEEVDYKDIYIDLYQRSLYKIGNDWEKGKNSIVDEHISSQIIEFLLHRFAPTVSKIQKNGRKAVLLCIDKEQHSIGALMASHVFEFNGWDTLFLGKSTPNKESLKLIEQRRPEILGVSFNFYLNIKRLTDLIELIRTHYPNQKIVIGGQGLKENNIDALSVFSDIQYFTSIIDLDRFLKEFE
jgi:methanogenic corrinoid protein MtbC1